MTIHNNERTDNMKVRRELNYYLFMRKSADISSPPYISEKEKYVDIVSGNVCAVNRGTEELKKTLSERNISENAVKNTLYNFILSAGAVTSACTENGMSSDEACALSDIYIKKADKCTDEEGLCILYGQMLSDFAERMQEIKKESVVSLHVRKCIDYIYGHLGEPLTVYSLAQYCGIDPSYLSSLFVKETGVKLRQFILTAKTDTAKDLLQYSHLSYTEISAALGFSSQSAFISVFKRFTGTTPKKFREKKLRLSGSIVIP